MRFQLQKPWTFDTYHYLSTGKCSSYQFFSKSVGTPQGLGKKPRQKQDVKETLQESEDKEITDNGQYLLKWDTQELRALFSLFFTSAKL